MTPEQSIKTDTPETDKATFQILSSLQSGTEKVVHAEICAKLERERNAAIEALENHKALAIHTCSQYCQRPLCVANRKIAEMWEVIKEIYAEADACADGAPDASSHDKLCLEIAAKLQPFLKP